MTAIPLYQLDAFTDRPFGGNPAAVCPLDAWLPDDVLQNIAMENNLSETAFFVPDGDGYELRWFTPAAEVELCGHATLASAALILERLRPDLDTVAFGTRFSGALTVTRDGDRFVMDFPALPASEVPAPDGLADALGGIAPVAYLRAVKNMAVLETKADVARVAPDFDFIRSLEGYGLIVTAPGDDTDFVCRYFAPHVGIPEDPVTGSAHCTLAPYWAERLGKAQIHSRQISARSGDVYCEVVGDRVRLAGHARMVIEGTMTL